MSPDDTDPKFFGLTPNTIFGWVVEYFFDIGYEISQCLRYSSFLASPPPYSCLKPDLI